MSVVRSLLALCLLLLAAAAGFLGLGAHWVHTAATTSGPLVAIMAPVPSDEDVVAAIKETLVSEVTSRIPPAAAAVPGASEALLRAITVGVDATVTDERFTTAWTDTVDLSRERFVADLGSFADDGVEVPTLWLDLTPFADLGRTVIYEQTAPALHRLLDQIPWPEEVTVALGRPEDRTARLAAEGLSVASSWPLFYGAAALLTARGLAVGSRRGRWVALIGAAVVSLVVLLAGWTVVGRIRPADAGTLAGAVKQALLSGTAESLAEFAAPAWFVVIGALIVGVLGLTVAGLRSERRAS